MAKIKQIFNDLEGWLLMVLMAAISIIIFVQVVFRQLGMALPWSEEASRYLAVWITFIGAAQGVKKGAHVGVEAFMLMFPVKVRKLVNILSVLICVFLCAVIGNFSTVIIRTQIVNRQVSPAMQFPIWIAYTAIPVGMALMIIRYIQIVYTCSRKFGNPAVITGLEK
jgi:C4-dicarboxylate transporter DctQ subunit